MRDFPEQSTTAQRTRSPRVALWDELERLHAQLGLPVPTATLTIDDLQAEIARLTQQAQE